MFPVEDTPSSSIAAQALIAGKSVMTPVRNSDEPWSKLGVNCQILGEWSSKLEIYIHDEATKKKQVAEGKRIPVTS
jgi:hypothetical protein